MIPDTASPAASTIVPDGESLTVDSLLDIARDPTIQVELTPEIRKRVIASRKLLDEFVDSGRVIYGVTTSVGGFVNWLVPPTHAEETQNNIMRSVQTNVGAYLDDHYVRASMLARINSLGRGYSAISIENLDKYVAMYNRGVLPCIPEKGSLGASGDLGPLACIGLVGTGQWRAKFDGEVMPGAEAMKKAGIEPMKLSYKEGLALINGTSVMTAIAACLVAESKSLIKAYTLASCLSLEVHKAKIMPFHPAAHRQKPHVGQKQIAECIYDTLADSKMIVQDEETEKWLRSLASDEPTGLDQQIEDVYSIRGTPQILGPVVDTTVFVQQTVETEINSSNDNPLVVVEDGEAVHNANFHGQYIANAMDQLAIVLVNMCNLSDRRNNRLLHPSLNGSLPPFLVKENAGVRMGLMGGQFLATSLTAEVRQMCMPMSIQTLPSTGDFQDHVSFGMVAARRTRDILDNARHILAYELMCACQAADLRGIDQLSSATRALYDMVREHVPYLDHDEPLTDHLETLAAMFASGEFLKAVPQEVKAYNW
ncbi:MAG: aromatic amino acid ammonia-lyase [Acidiferrobacterales bacterium]